MDPFSIVLLVAASLCFVIYMLDRKGWNATAKRLSTIVRANIEAAKPIKQLESSSKKTLEQKIKDNWSAEFTGQQLDNGLKHVIVKTWYARVSGNVYPHWKCKCGVSDWHISTDRAREKSKAHVRYQNNAEELLKKNGGTHAW